MAKSKKRKGDGGANLKEPLGEWLEFSRLYDLLKTDESRHTIDKLTGLVHHFREIARKCQRDRDKAGCEAFDHAADDVYRFIVELLEDFNGEAAGREPPQG